MITPSDPEYLATKLVKQGKAVIDPCFDDFVEWINITWDVEVLNLDYRSVVDRERLQVIFEHDKDVRVFRKTGLGYKSAFQQRVKSRFIRVCRQHGLTDFDTPQSFVIFLAFAPIAIIETHDKVTDAQRRYLVHQIGNPDLWHIESCFDRVVFFFYTEKQKQLYESLGDKDCYAREYLKILKPHDEFDYLSEDAFKIEFDSKENFDDNYKSNWFYYHR